VDGSPSLWSIVPDIFTSKPSIMRMPALLTALVIACTTLAQSTPDEMVRTFFNSYSNGKVEKAVRDIYQTNPWMARKTDDIDNLKRQLLGAIDLMGEYRGYGLLGTKDIQSDLVMFDYLVKYDRQPMRFRFMFYRPQKEWMLYSFSYDDAIDDELKELVKMTYLHP
jgi:hypothetical protein